MAWGCLPRLPAWVWPSDCRSHCTELVVAESVVVIKKLLQMQPAQHGEIIKHLAKLTDNIQVSQRPHFPSNILLVMLKSL